MNKDVTFEIRASSKTQATGLNVSSGLARDLNEKYSNANISGVFRPISTGVSLLDSELEGL